MSPDLRDRDDAGLREVVSELRIAVATLNATVRALESSLAHTVTLDRFQSVKDDVDGLLKLRDWAIALVLGAVIVALLGLVVTGGTST